MSGNFNSPKIGGIKIKYVKIFVSFVMIKILIMAKKKKVKVSGNYATAKYPTPTNYMINTTYYINF